MISGMFVQNAAVALLIGHPVTGKSYIAKAASHAIGVFPALGVTFTLLFVHFVLPKIFPSMPAATRPANSLLLNGLKKIAAPDRWKLASAAIFTVIMLFFAKPVFNIDLNTMNSVSQETIADENSIQKSWGDLSGKCYVFLQAPSIDQLQQKNEQLMAILSKDVQAEKLSSVFLPSSMFPSPETGRRNLEAWRNFWNTECLARLKQDIKEASLENGFEQGAFDPFWQMIDNENLQSGAITETYLEMFRITKGVCAY